MTDDSTRRGFLAILAGTYTASMFPVSKATAASLEKQLDRPQCPSGLILMWSTNVPYIPKGWAICNGDKGTPDLRCAASLMNDHLVLYIMKL